MKSKPQTGILATHLTDKGPIFRIYKVLHTNRLGKGK